MTIIKYIHNLKQKNAASRICVWCHERIPAWQCTEEARLCTPDPWCYACKEDEDKRSLAEDYLGNYLFKRPPRYVLPMSEWPNHDY